MRTSKLTARDWEEIYYALELKAERVEQGCYDFVPNEVNRPRSESSAWAAHLHRIMAKIGAR